MNAWHARAQGRGGQGRGGQGRRAEEGHEQTRSTRRSSKLSSRDPFLTTANTQQSTKSTGTSHKIKFASRESSSIKRDGS